MQKGLGLGGRIYSLYSIKTITHKESPHKQSVCARTLVQM